MTTLDSLNVSFPDQLVDTSPGEPSGYSDDVARCDSCESYADAGLIDFPDHLWIEPREWKEWAQRNDEQKLWPEDYRNRFTNQSPTHECTCHALLQCFETAWNQQRRSKQDAVFVSALSIYAEANPRRYGGASCKQVLGIAMDRGFLPEHNGPGGPGSQRDKYKHTLNCSSSRSERDGGPWVPLSQFPDGWQQTGRHFRPLKAINVRSWEQHVCLVLRGRAVGNGRSGHSIPHVRIVWRGGDLYSAYSDSYDVIRYDSVRAIKAGVGAAYAIESTVIPDDWARPAGSDMQ